jgi:SAM-dependent methyltransferase
LAPGAEDGDGSGTLSVDPRIFDAYYYAHGCGEPYQRSPAWLALFNAIAERIALDIQPASVLDAGCAIGLLVECLRQRSVAAWGIDISEYAIQNVPAEIRPYCQVASAAETLERDYDLIVSIEVLEHMAPQEAQAAIANFCQHSDDILFSSTPFDYQEASHFNVQPPEAWAELFARHGFYRDVDFDASFITPWAARFRKSQEPIQRIVRNYERRYWLLWKENTDLRKLSLEMRDQLAKGEEDLHASQDQIKALQSQVEQKSAEIQNLKSGLEALTQSRSWRVIQFLRRLLGRGG